MASPYPNLDSALTGPVHFTMPLPPVLGQHEPGPPFLLEPKMVRRSNRL